MAGRVGRDALRRIPLARRMVLASRFGSLRRAEPLSTWGSERGTPVDRWYIEGYLADHAEVVRGHVLEVKNDRYASKLGAARVEVVDLDAGNTRATLVGDLCDPTTLQPGSYDAAVVTQTLQFLADPTAAVRHLMSALLPGGSLIVTVPCLSRLDGPGDFWRWTPAGLRRLLDAAAPGAVREVRGLGNGLAARAFLFGLAAEDLDADALQVQDSDQPLVVAALLRAAG